MRNHCSHSLYPTGEAIIQLGKLGEAYHQRRFQRTVPLPKPTRNRSSALAAPTAPAPGHENNYSQVPKDGKRKREIYW
jgi:hypothetical protein